MAGPIPKIAFVASGTAASQQCQAELKTLYPHVGPDEADIVVALGGDGFLLQMLHEYIGRDAPIYGMNFGDIGFLMNEYRPDGLIERLVTAEKVILHPLRMNVLKTDGTRHAALAINEVSLVRQSNQAAKLRISVDGKVRIKELICDGALVATPAGSTAYNLSAHGPILPLDSNVLALTPISAFRPRRWRGAILPHASRVELEVLEADKRPVAAVADTTEIRDAVHVTVAEDRGVELPLLFDAEHNLAERILREQFSE